jgi:hypothetical protein
MVSQTDPGAAYHLPEQEFVKPPVKDYSTLPEISEQTGDCLLVFVLVSQSGYI